MYKDFEGLANIMLLRYFYDFTYLLNYLYEFCYSIYAGLKKTSASHFYVFVFVSCGCEMCTDIEIFGVTKHLDCH